jgi:hypothetical protein
VGFVGGKVAAANSDPVLHTTSLAFAADGKAIANVALPGAGARIERSLRRAGLVSVRCDTHEWMQGWLHVFEHPYATITDASGAFTLTDVPAGTHELRAWHERLGELTLRVTLEPGKAATVDLAFP